MCSCSLSQSPSSSVSHAPFVLGAASVSGKEQERLVSAADELGNHWGLDAEVLRWVVATPRHHHKRAHERAAATLLQLQVRVIRDVVALGSRNSDQSQWRVHRVWAFGRPVCRLELRDELGLAQHQLRWHCLLGHLDPSTDQLADVSIDFVTLIPRQLTCWAGRLTDDPVCQLTLSL